MRAGAIVGMLIAGGLALPVAAGAHGQVEVHADPLRALLSGPPLATLGAAQAGLAATWCGPQTEADDIAHEVGDRKLHKVKLVEAHPMDVAPSAAVRDRIQAVAGQMIDHLATESAGRRSLRLDLGTACGPEYVDIATIRLPQPRAFYDADCSANARNLFLHIRERLPKADGPRNATAFLHGVSCPGIAGWGEITTDDRPGPENQANQGGRIALAISHDVVTALHETGHNLGAVQRTAPHSDAAGHCWDEDDIMCYPYTSLTPQSPVRPCGTAGGVEPFDCNKDDYFSAAPTPGSWLATHWNLFSSHFMCELATCTGAGPDPDPDPDPGPSPDPDPDPDPDPPQQDPRDEDPPPPDDEQQPEQGQSISGTSTAPPPPPVENEPARSTEPPAPRLSLSGRLRGRFVHVNGRVLPVPCGSGGRVRVSVHAGARRLLTRSLAIGPDCRFRRRMTISPRARRSRLTLRASYAGAKPVVRVVR